MTAHMISDPNKDEAEVERLSPLRAERIGILKYKRDAVAQLTKNADGLVNEVVQRYAKELDELIVGVEQTLRQMKESGKKISTADLQRLVLRIPILLYRVIDPVDLAGLESDVAQTAHKMVRSEHFYTAPGTIPDKNRVADLKSGDEATLVDLAKRVHNRLRRRVEVAQLLFDAVRKLMSSNDTEKQIFAHDKN